ncbi:choline dehydrogenase-like flavoprotein [Mariniflexile fucanivorans]|uniref:Choline dehydrogenase-like flavoprotein n=1 Tax=Mariniflexile fucanivorans TaxID=264023 RepID=A0A4R1RNV5_9FLAO|nr:GMC family oxidoreductase [Mariniflexile fucanivorans]TCL67926.1 choline dehydrogenase-like flavoprotein [Mariniflexile fucanivorans]
MKNQTEKNTFDAIVVGSGISGGWAAKELTEGGLKTLVLERGRNVEHIVDYTTAFKNPWDFKHRTHLTNEELDERPVQSSHCNAADMHFYVKDSEHPYVQVNPFKWIRGYQVGGRSLTWGRQSYRFSDLDFEANKKDGHGVDWPIRYNDLKEWYDYVEDYVGISGSLESLPHLPDGVFLPPIPMNAIEKYLKESVSKQYSDRLIINGRVANLTERKKGRGQCMYCNLCSRGCPFSGYFSSNSSTLLDAYNSGNLTLRENSVVKEVIYDETKKEAVGVKIIDAITKEEISYYAKIIFLNASAIATAAILLNSVSESFPNGLGNSSQQVGHNLMDHVVNEGTYGTFDGLQDKYYEGRSPGTIFIPRFQNLNNETKNTDFVRGYGIQGKGERENWETKATTGFGASLKAQLQTPGEWKISLGGRGEVLPNYENKISLDYQNRDSWGLPIVKVHFEYGSNELAMMEHMTKTSEEMLVKAGFKNVGSYRNSPPPGSAVHEMGTARMGHDPKTSVLNKHNQMHDVKNVFITDGSCMTSSASQNPSLTYMAITARACKFAIDQFHSNPS